MRGLLITELAADERKYNQIKKEQEKQLELEKVLISVFIPVYLGLNETLACPVDWVLSEMLILDGNLWDTGNQEKVG